MLKKSSLILALNIPDLCRKPTRERFGAGALGVNARGGTIFGIYILRSNPLVLVDLYGSVNPLVHGDRPQRLARQERSPPRDSLAIFFKPLGSRPRWSASCLRKAALFFVFPVPRVLTPRP